MDLVQYFKSGGMFMYPILVCSVIALGIILEKCFDIYRSRSQTEKLWSQLTGFLPHGDYQNALAFLQLSKGVLPKLLWSYLANVQHGESFAQDVLRHEALKEMQALDSHMKGLAVIANVATMLGLLGTISGLIRAFYAIQRMGGQVDPSVLAGGIGEAMITTYTGLIVAIPIVVCHSLLEGIIDKIAASIEDYSGRLKNYLSNPKGISQVG